MSIDENKVRENVANASLDELYGLITDLGIISPNVISKEDWDILCQLIETNPDASIDELIALFMSYMTYKKYRK